MPKKIHTIFGYPAEQIMEMQQKKRTSFTLPPLVKKEPAPVEDEQARLNQERDTRIEELTKENAALKAQLAGIFDTLGGGAT